MAFVFVGLIVTEFWPSFRGTNPRGRKVKLLEGMRKYLKAS